MSEENGVNSIRPYPKAGVIDNLETLKVDGVNFRTIIGSVTSNQDPKRSPEKIPVIPGLGMYYWKLNVNNSGGEKDIDDQKPHFQDEVYLILEGDGSFQLGDKSEKVSITTGDVIFVPARMRHNFIVEKSDIRILVFFGPDWCGRDAAKIQD